MKYPTFGPGERMEILGTKGVFLIDHDNKDQIFYTDCGIPHSYVPDHGVNMAFMSTSSSGDWAQGDFWGPVADETRTWLDHLSTGRPCSLATAEDARRTLEITLAIEHASQSHQTVRFPPED
jgi:predicted dehydrogenase